nr:protein S-acyltransferase 21 [Onthophagus taurus]
MLSSVDNIRKLRRVHGLQLPLHPLQVSGWLTIASLSTGSFLVVIPALPPNWQSGALATLSTLLLLHLASHLGASLVDPAEPELRKNVPVPVPELDRSKHIHVIEDGNCNLCKIKTTSDRTKHCGACNKCVEGFDHHCKWLNHCVGARNYVTFLMCVSTAVAAAAFVAILAIAELIFHQTESGWFSKPDNITLPIQSSLPSSDAAFLAVVAALGLLAAITAGLLLHLCFFHIYISFLGLTTYEYIRQQRPQPPQQPQEPQQPPPTEDTRNCSNLRHRPVDLLCEGRSRMTVYTCTVIEETVSCVEPTPTPPTTPQDCNSCVTNQNSIAPTEKPTNKKVKQKWNCCVSVPDSPDSPLEPRCLMSLCKHKMRKKIPAIEGRNHRTHGHWSSAKLRVLFRVLSNFGNHRSRQQKTVPAKNNQVAPLSQDGNNSDKSQQIQTISNLVPVPSLPDQRNHQPHLSQLPTLPPPQRQRMISEVELTNALTALQQQQQQRCLGRRTLPQYRRRRRSNVHRTKTPTLSPIRESGLSNPASPSRQNCTLTTGTCTRPF